MGCADEWVSLVCIWESLSGVARDFARWNDVPGGNLAKFYNILTQKGRLYHLCILVVIIALLLYALTDKKMIKHSSLYGKQVASSEASRQLIAKISKAMEGNVPLNCVCQPSVSK